MYDENKANVTYPLSNSSHCTKVIGPMAKPKAFTLPANRYLSYATLLMHLRCTVSVLLVESRIRLCKCVCMTTPSSPETSAT